MAPIARSSETSRTDATAGGPLPRPDPSPGVGKREGIVLRGQFSNPRVGDRITPATGGRFDRD